MSFNTSTFPSSSTSTSTSTVNLKNSFMSLSTPPTHLNRSSSSSSPHKVKAKDPVGTFITSQRREGTSSLKVTKESLKDSKDTSPKLKGKGEISRVTGDVGGRGTQTRKRTTSLSKNSAQLLSSPPQLPPLSSSLSPLLPFPSLASASSSTSSLNLNSSSTPYHPPSFNSSTSTFIGPPRGARSTASTSTNESSGSILSKASNFQSSNHSNQSNRSSNVQVERKSQSSTSNTSHLLASPSSSSSSAKMTHNNHHHQKGLGSISSLTSLGIGKGSKSRKSIPQPLTIQPSNLTSNLLTFNAQNFGNDGKTKIISPTQSPLPTSAIGEHPPTLILPFLEFNSSNLSLSTLSSGVDELPTPSPLSPSFRFETKQQSVREEGKGSKGDKSKGPWVIDRERKVSGRGSEEGTTSPKVPPKKETVIKSSSPSSSRHSPASPPFVNQSFVSKEFGTTSTPSTATSQSPVLSPSSSTPPIYLQTIDSQVDQVDALGLVRTTFPSRPARSVERNKEREKEREKIDGASALNVSPLGLTKSLKVTSSDLSKSSNIMTSKIKSSAVAAHAFPSPPPRPRTTTSASAGHQPKTSTSSPYSLLLSSDHFEKPLPSLLSRPRGQSKTGKDGEGDEDDIGFFNRKEERLERDRLRWEKEKEKERKEKVLVGRKSEPGLRDNRRQDFQDFHPLPLPHGTEDRRGEREIEVEDEGRRMRMGKNSAPPTPNRRSERSGRARKSETSSITLVQTGSSSASRPSFSLKRSTSRSSALSSFSHSTNGGNGEKRLSSNFSSLNNLIGLSGRIKKRGSQVSMGSTSLGVGYEEKSEVASMVSLEDAKVLESLFVGPDASGPGAIAVENMDKMVEALRDTALSSGLEMKVKKVRKRQLDKQMEQERRREEEKRRILLGKGSNSNLYSNLNGKESSEDEDEDDLNSLLEKKWRKKRSSASSYPTTISTATTAMTSVLGHQTPGKNLHIPLPYVAKDGNGEYLMDSPPPISPHSPEGGGSSSSEEKKGVPTLNSLLKARPIGGSLHSPASMTFPKDVMTSPTSTGANSLGERKEEKKATLASLEAILARGSSPSIGRGANLRNVGRSLGVRGERISEEEGEDEKEGRLSLDSVTEEVVKSFQGPEKKPPLHHSKSFPSRPPGPGGLGSGWEREKEKRQFSYSDLQSTPSLPSSATVRTLGAPINAAERKTAEYLRSPRLTRLMKLNRSPNQKLTVSLCDLGRKDGHPVLVFLGMGAVRYLVGLYDEMADALGLRLICVDRWGLGRTTEVEESKRGFLEWASVIEEVLDQLEISRFSILAHSAGAPYALACSLRMDHRIVGSIHLLAPWVLLSDLVDSAEGTGGYKWLKFVPNGVIKTAHAAEWKVTSWKLGKAPKLAVEGVGYNKAAPVEWTKEGTSSFDLSDYDVLSDVGSRFSQEVQERWADGSAGGVKKSKLFGNLFDGKKPPSRKNVTPSSNLSRREQTRSYSKDDTLPTLSPRSSFLNRPPSVVSTIPSSNTVNTISAQPDYDPPPAQDIGTALLQASHAESLKGSTADLLTILGKNGRPFGFTYSQVSADVKVWHGDRDERIPLSSIRWMEREMLSCQVTVVQGADHSLMMNPKVVVDALESIADGG